jgi:hypothetical protein
MNKTNYQIGALVVVADTERMREEYPSAIGRPGIIDRSVYRNSNTKELHYFEYIDENPKFDWLESVDLEPFCLGLITKK